MKRSIFIALTALGICTLPALSEAQASRQGAAVARQVQALKTAMDAFASHAQGEINDLKDKIRDCGQTYHGTIDSNGPCPSGQSGNTIRQCIAGTWVAVFEEMATCQKIYRWVNLINRTETNTNACAREGMKPITEPGYATCASGENRFTDGQDYERISYRYGSWGPTRPAIGPNISANRAGDYCYHNSQRRDGDGSDLAVAALCEALDPGDPIPVPVAVGPYVPPPPRDNDR